MTVRGTTAGALMSRCVLMRRTMESGTWFCHVAKSIEMGCLLLLAQRPSSGLLRLQVTHTHTKLGHFQTSMPTLCCGAGAWRRPHAWRTLCLLLLLPQTLPLLHVVPDRRPLPLLHVVFLTAALQFFLCPT